MTDIIYKNLAKVALLTGLQLLTACSSTGNTANIQNSDRYLEKFPTVGINQISENNFKDVFKIGDTAEIDIYNIEALSKKYVIDRKGHVNFPLIGSIKVVGLTTNELQELLSEKYGQKYLSSPNINVTLKSVQIGRIVVDGSVSSPGVFDIKDIIRLSEAIALAEGLNTTETNGSKVFIIRTIEGSQKVTRVDLREIRNLNTVDPQIIPGDVIFVEDSAGKIVFNEFLKTVPLLNTAVIFATR